MNRKVFAAVLAGLLAISLALIAAERSRIVPLPTGKQLTLPVPGDPPGTTYRALLPEPERAPAVIYRPAFANEQGKWLVTTLMDRQAYRVYSEGLSEDPFVQHFATGVAAGTISASEFSAGGSDDGPARPGRR